MGLALAKRLAELNGAELSIESSKGAGTSAKIRIRQL